MERTGCRQSDAGQGWICKLSYTTYTYNGSAKKPTVKVTADGEGLDKSCYSVTYANNTNAGTATAKVTFKGDRYSGSKTLKFTIKKAANPLSIKAKTATVKYSRVKYKTQTLKVSNVIKVVKKGAARRAKLYNERTFCSHKAVRKIVKK